MICLLYFSLHHGLVYIDLLWKVNLFASSFGSFMFSYLCWLRISCFPICVDWDGSRSRIDCISGEVALMFHPTPTTLKRINFCWLYLWVNELSNIYTLAGNTIKYNALLGVVLMSSSDANWPIQPWPHVQSLVVRQCMYKPTDKCRGCTGNGDMWYRAFLWFIGPPYTPFPL